MLTFGKTGCCTSRCNCCIDYFSMTKSCNCFLCNKNLVTYRTMLTFGKTCCCASRSYCFVNYFGMSKLCNYRLSNGNLATYGAVLTFRKTGCRASRSNCYIGYFFMTKCINRYCFTANFCTTYCTINYVIVRTAIYAISINVIFNNRQVCYMTKLRFKLSTTHCTSLCCCTGCICASSMSKCRNCLLCNENLITY